MEEYLNLGHMEPVDDNENVSCCYLTHHPFVSVSPDSEPSADRQLRICRRVVFNDVQRYSNGTSLNDYLLPGPKLQMDISAIVTRWRLFGFVFTTDIEKMFRQILVHPDDRDWQRILWRRDGNQPIQDYRLKTVTYGTRSAPFLALRVLQQLAEDGEGEYPEAAKALRQQCYVGTGADDLAAALRLRDQLIKLLASAGMQLGKWNANYQELLKGLSETGGLEHSIELDQVVSTLGLKWVPQTDHFCFKVTVSSRQKVVTKRHIASETAKLFDPLGWLAPVLIRAKILLQDLWCCKLDWDTPVSEESLSDWISFRNQLVELEGIRIQRRFGVAPASGWQIHAFADASKRAYAAAIFIVQSGCPPQLVVAKTKVDPTKTVSLPRLELCGAVLAVRLLNSVLEQLSNQPDSLHCWSDSKVVLAWLDGHPSRWNTFVANRTSEVLTTCRNATWRHVPSADNPADCATRGYTPEQLKNSTLWWHGPTWLSLSRSSWPELMKKELNEEEKLVVNAHVAQHPEGLSITSQMERYSSFNKMLRVLAYVFRWKRNAKMPKARRNGGPLSASELEDARAALYKAVQRERYAAELSCIQHKKPLSKSSELVRLLPFVDSHGLLRVGGRLEHANLPYDERHPIILPKSCVVTKRLVEEAHAQTLHGGVQLMTSHLNRSVWIPRGRRLYQAVAHGCVKCARFAAQPGQQQMAPLPAVRLHPQRAFLAAGLDYAGPFTVKCSKGRGIKKDKGYVAIFVCLVVKAVHIEIVSDLTTDAFLAAFYRFTSRRGHCKVVYSDNATTFKGAAAEIARLFQATSSMSAEIAAQVAKDGTTWSFIPPRAPHFGGLWEAAVKSFKYHFVRVIGEAALTYEELATLASLVEACLNSRPLCPMSNEPNDLNALTPGHFLIGSALTTRPEPFTEVDLTGTLRRRWQLVTRMRNNFWHRWSKEVLQQAQLRNKWLKSSSDFKLGDMVLIKDDLQPPSKWPLGRVIHVHPGEDGLIRVVTVRTATSEFKRPTVKVIRLPVDADVTEMHDRVASIPAKVDDASLTAGGSHTIPSCRTIYKIVT